MHKIKYNVLKEDDIGSLKIMTLGNSFVKVYIQTRGQAITEVAESSLRKANIIKARIQM